VPFIRRENKPNAARTCALARQNGILCEMIQQADKKLVDEFITELLAKIERNLDKIIFFGSRAKGI